MPKPKMPKVSAPKNKSGKKNAPAQTVVILDAHAIIHRAYHALPSFMNSRGEPTGALYGLVAMLIRIIDEFKPHAIVAAFDLPKPTFRHHAYDQYKAGRAKTDDELVMQIVAARKLFDVFGIPVLDAEGFEADDVVGTLAKTLLPKTTRVIIASGDMDTLQLVENDRVVVYTLKKGITDTALYTEDAVRTRYGFMPSQLIDYKALRGDPSDNIIGVPGIGEKTATTLVSVFGTIEKMYTALKKHDARFTENKISERIQNLLIEHADDAAFSKTLATIRVDVPVVYEIPEESFQARLDEKKIMEYLYDMEFKSLITRVKKIFVEKGAEKMGEKKSEGGAEGGNSDMESGESETGGTARETAGGLFETKSGNLSGNPELVEKAAIALWVLQSEHTIANEETILQFTRTSSIEEAYETLLAALDKEGLRTLYDQIELPLIPIIHDMHEHGIRIDPKKLTEIGGRLQKKMNEIISEVHTMVGHEFNLGSPKQLSVVLFEELKLIPKGKRRASGAFTTNADALETMRDLHPIIPLILEYREVQKLQGTYIEPLLAALDTKNYVHADFYQNGSTTGRFSSAHPNLQNIPIGSDYAKDIRSAFIAGEGNVFVSADYSQIELRVLAMLSGDEKLTGTFLRGEDIHAAVAATVFGVDQSLVTPAQRRAAKVINFGIIYGMGVTALQKNLGTTRDEAATFYDNYFRSFPRIASFLENTKKDALRLGYTTTMFGRRRYFPGLLSKLPHIKAFAERMASNAPIQGTAADLIKIAIVLIKNELEKQKLTTKAHLLLQIHDELVYEVSEKDAAIVKQIIETAMRNVIVDSPIPVPKTDVPLDVSSAVGDRLDLLK